MLEVLHEERFETMALSSMTLLTIGLSRFLLNFSCSSHSPSSPSLLMTMKVFIRLVRTCNTVESDTGFEVGR